jgi:DNA mismatch repair protein MutL
VVVSDLFFATPARRKFLKAARTEAEHAEQAAARLAFAAPHAAFRLEVDGRVAFDLPVQDRAARVDALLRAGVALLPVLASRDTQAHGSLVMTGFAAPAMHTRATAAAQSLVVNGRPVADPVLRTAVRVAYRDVIEHGRHPVVALYLDVPPETLDVNVHPAKTELRFQDPAAIRSLVIGGLRAALGVGAGASVAGWAPRPPGGHTTRHRPHLHLVSNQPRMPAGYPGGFSEPVLPLGGQPPGVAAAFAPPGARGLATAPAPRPEHPLGAAIAQIFDTYILAVSAEGSLVLVDQHAAHERLTHEALHAQRVAGGVQSQALLLPAVVDMAPADAARLAAAADSLAALGLEIEAFGAGAILVRALPAALGAPDPRPLLQDVADALAESGTPAALEARLDAVVARLACHGSIRAGRRLNQAEMDALLRQMEVTPRAATCSHGRPTVLKLSRAEIESLFGRR